MQIQSNSSQSINSFQPIALKDPVNIPPQGPAANIGPLDSATISNTQAAGGASSQLLNGFANNFGPISEPSSAIQNPQSLPPIPVPEQGSAGIGNSVPVPEPGSGLNPGAPSGGGSSPINGPLPLPGGPGPSINIPGFPSSGPVDPGFGAPGGGLPNVDPGFGAPTPTPILGL